MNAKSSPAAWRPRPYFYGNSLMNSPLAFLTPSLSTHVVSHSVSCLVSPSLPPSIYGPGIIPRVTAKGLISEVAKVDRAVRFVMCVPPCFLQVSFQDVSFASVFEGNVSFVR